LKKRKSKMLGPIKDHSIQTTDQSGDDPNHNERNVLDVVFFLEKFSD
jgi:hypothetical protein